MMKGMGKQALQLIQAILQFGVQIIHLTLSIFQVLQLGQSIGCLLITRLLSRRHALLPLQLAQLSSLGT